MLLAHVWLAAVLVRLGQLSEARALVAEIKRAAPRMTLEHWHAPKLYSQRRHSENMIGALRESGFQ
jgi:hypothetical protein